MTNRTAWVAGLGAGLTWTSAFGTEINSLAATPASVASSVVIANGTALDQFMDISIALTASSTATAGGNIAFYLYPLNEDGTTYGDNSPTAPTLPPCAIITTPAATSLVGTALMITIPPGSFKLVVQNNSGVALASSAGTIKYRTYNINLNS